MKRAIDLTAGALLFGFGALIAFHKYDCIIAYPPTEHVFWWYCLLPFIAGCTGGAAAIGLIFQRRVPGLVGSLSMLMITLSYMPFLLHFPVINDLMPAMVCFLMSVVAYRRFVREPRRLEN